MSDPYRYLDDARADRLARDLLRSAGDDDLDDARADDLVRVIGARAGLAPAANDGAARVRPPPASGTRLVLVTTLALTVVGAALFTYAETRAPRSSTATATATPSVTPSEPAPAERPVDVAAPPEAPAAPAAEAVPVELLPDATPDPASTRPTRNVGGQASKAPPPSGSSELSAELRALERVRVAIDEHRIADAREGLQSYERTFPTKLLENEARVLEIEALVADGRRKEADALARAFLATSGDTPYATRVRSLTGAPRAPRLP